MPVPLFGTSRAPRAPAYLTSAHARITDRPVTTITCRIPEELNDRLTAEAARALVPKSVLLRRALEQSLAQRPAAARRSAFDRVKDLCGIIGDGPTDMSTNPDYLKDFGR